ncbi:hypothetical protein V493_05832, partial [Pseudogymnoascus sp. VKM F-4281 (FW-2241)]
MKYEITRLLPLPPSAICTHPATVSYQTLHSPPPTLPPSFRVSSPPTGLGFAVLSSARAVQPEPPPNSSTETYTSKTEQNKTKQSSHEDADNRCGHGAQCAAGCTPGIATERARRVGDRCQDMASHSPHNHEPDFPPAFAPHSGYKAPNPMMSGGTPFSPAPSYARFETGPNGMAIDPKPVNDDALPPMPSWDTAAKRRVSIEDQPGAVELGELDPVTGQRMPLMTGAAGAAAISRSNSPAIGTAIGGASPYGRPNDQLSRNGSNGGFGGDQGLSPMGAPGQAYGGRGYSPQNQNQFIGQAQAGPDEQFGNHAIGNAYSDDRQSPYPGDDRGPQGGAFGVMPAPGFGQHQRNDSGQRPFTGDRAHVPA